MNSEGGFGQAQMLGHGTDNATVQQTALCVLERKKWVKTGRFRVNIKDK